MGAEIEIIQIRDGDARRMRDVIATEVPLTVFLNDKEVATLLTSDMEFKPLAVGFLFSEGFLQNKDDLSGLFESMERKIVRVYTKEGRKPETEGGMITSGCGRGRSYAAYNLETLSLEQQPDAFQVSAEAILGLMHALQVFRKIGGMHTCALAEPDRMVLFKEDIGRHNAVDRILGTCFLEGIPLENKIILTSGRASSEIVFKAARGRISILVSRSAATDLAIRIAEQAGITLVGYARGRRMNIYAHPERIVW